MTSSVAVVARSNIKRVLWTWLSMVLLLPPLASASAQVIPITDTPRAQAPPDASELEAFLNDFLPEQMAELDVPGLVFVMVRVGEVAFAKGYGFADVEQQIPFDPERTIVRAGSIVKTITATALMQLAERGLIDLDADVNQYLTSFQIPATYAEPVTARQLLHYTAGFDSRFIGIRVPNESDLMPLERYLGENLPARTRPPGTIRAYNDQEIALAGLLVEAVSGMPYEQYVRENILQPAGMNSTFQVVPEDQLDRAATGYGSGGPYPSNYYYLHNAPGAGINTTAMDLAHYMILHLQDGRFGEQQVLAPETAKEMHSTGFRHHESLPGIAYTFDEVLIGERRFLMKSGGAPGFNNRMILDLDSNVGIYFSYNRDSSVPLQRRLENELLDRFFDVGENARLEPLPESADSASRYAGYYRGLNDSSSKTIEKMALIGHDVPVTANADGSLNLFGSRMIEVEPGLFQWDDGFFAAFGEEGSGDVTHFFVARSAWERVPWYETESVQMGALGFAVLVFLSGAIAWGVALIKRTARSRLLTGLLSVSGLAFVIGLVVVMMPVFSGSDPPWAFTFAPPTPLLVVLAIPLLSAALTVAALVENIKAWANKRGSTVTRLHNSLIVLGGLAFIFFLNTWNLLGYRL